MGYSVVTLPSLGTDNGVSRFPYSGPNFGPVPVHARGGFSQVYIRRRLTVGDLLSLAV
jgi:hypothetical protein